MKKLVAICLLLAVFFTTQVLAAAKLTKDTKIPEAIAIEIDKGKFDENSLYGIYDDLGNLIAQYDRLDNDNSKVRSIKVFDNNKEHIYTISGVDTDQAIYIMSKDGKRAKIQANATLKGFKMQITADVKFYGRPYDLAVFIDAGFKGMASTYIVSYETKPVIKESMTFSMDNGSKKEVLVDKVFLNENKDECVVWILALFALDEMSRVSQELYQNQNHKN